jgi:hypothetical protein
MLQVRGIILNGEMLFRGFDDWSDEEKNTPWFCLPTKHIHNALFFFSFCLPKKKQKGPRKPPPERTGRNIQPGFRRKP